MGILLHPEGRPYLDSELARLVAGKESGVSALPMRELLAELHDRRLIEPTSRSWRSAPIASLLRKRKSDRVRQRRKRGGCHAKNGVMSRGCHAGVTRDPPMVSSPPITPSSSLSPISLSPPDGRDVTPEERQAAYQAFDQWSSKSPNLGGRGYGLRVENNEHSHVSGMLETLAQEPPVLHVGQQVLRHRLAPIVADALAKGNTPFKGIEWACKCVRNKIDEWGRDKPEAKGNGTHRKPLATGRVHS